MGRRLVVVGGVAAGMSAASRARRLDPELAVMVFERTGHVSYGSCGLPYFLGGLIERPEALVVYTPEFFWNERRIAVHVHHEVTAIDPNRHTVRVRALNGDGVERVEPYDVLILATGASAQVPSVAGAHRPGVYTLRTLEDGVRLQQALEELRQHRTAGGPTGRVAMIGAGPLGVEVAENLRRRELDVLLVEMAPQVLPGYHPAVAGAVDRALRAHGVQLLVGAPLEAIVGQSAWDDDGAPVGAVRVQGEAYPVGMVILGTGVRPNVELARAAGLRLGPTGALWVDDRQRTSVSDIFAAGDGVETRHRISGRPVWIPLGTTSNKQGRVAGENAAGGNATFPGVVGTAVFQAFGVEAGRTGLTVAEAQEAGFEPAEVAARQGSAAHYFPGGGPVDVVLVGDRRSGRLLGAQMAGPAGSVAKRLDVLATAVTAGLPVAEVADLDLSYAPPVAPVWDPVLIAAREWLRRWGAAETG